MQAGESAPIGLASKALAHAAIDSFLAQTSGRMVNITAPNGATLTIGICASDAVLAYQSSLDPPYYISKGTGDDIDGYVTLDFGGEPTDYPGSSVVPAAAAVRAARVHRHWGEARHDRLAGSVTRLCGSTGSDKSAQD